MTIVPPVHRGRVRALPPSPRCSRPFARTSVAAEPSTPVDELLQRVHLRERLLSSPLTMLRGAGSIAAGGYRSRWRAKRVMVTPVPRADVRPHRKSSVVSAVRDGTLSDADFRGCRWIEDDPWPLRPGMFCGLAVASGERWCAKHRGVVFGKSLRRNFCRRVWPGAPPRDGGTDAASGLARLQADTSTEHAAG